MSRPETSVGEALVSLLEGYGVDTVFGIPGVHNVEMYRALPRSRIRHVLTRHEQGAGFMADGYARATGRPGVCFTITGPGLLNILTPMGEAWADSSPVLVVSSALDIADAAQGRGRLHEMQNQRQAAASVATRSLTAFTALDVRDAFASAFSAFAAERPRPCYVELPLDLLSMPCGEGWTARGVPARPRPAAEAVARAIDLLAEAEHPLVLLGGGAVDAGVAARAIAERLGAVVVTTVAGKGIVPESHPLNLGARLAQGPVKKLLGEVDVVLAVGSEISETDLWDSSVRIPGRIIRVDLDAATLARPHAAEVPILADAKATLEAIAAALPAQGWDHRHRKNEAFVSGYLAREASHDDELQAMLRAVLTVVRETLPPDTVIASDMTQIAYAANYMMPMEVPRAWLHPTGFGTLGFALPAAIGAKAGLPHRTVAALAGDYGFQYTLNEIGTAAELGQSLPILLWNNDALGQIRDDMVQKGIQPNAVTLRNPDFQMLARAYGCVASKPSSLGALAEAIAASLEAKGPTLIEMTPRMVRG